jgi:Immunoglobulin domain/Immunoglobulin I-set domain
MKKYLACVAGLLLLTVAGSRADTTVTNNTADAFAAALAQTLTNGGGTILVPVPIVINTAVGFDGVSNVVVSGGNSNSIFLVQGGNLSLTNLTLENGLGTNGGAIYVAVDGTLTLSNCIFLGNTARGADGESGDTNGFGSNTPNTGKNGGRGGSALPGFGGAIFNVGALSVFNCSFFTNSAIGGSGSDGGDGQDANIRGGSGGPGGKGAPGRGGGIYNLGALVCLNSSFEGNLADGGNGGAGGAGGGGLIPGTSAKGGTAGDAAGAGLYTTNTDVLIWNCTFANNTSQGGNGTDGGTSAGRNGLAGLPGGNAFGAGIDNEASLAIVNSTFFENNVAGGTGGAGGTGARGGSGGRGGNAIGGGLYNAGNVSVVNCTFSKGAAIGGTNGVAGSGVAAGRNGNRGSSSGGNIANVAKKKKGSLYLTNSIVATSLSGGNGSGVIVDGGFNISSDGTIKFAKKSTSKPKLNPLIGDLADNGGPTATLALSTNSPAVDRIDPVDAPDTDQRGKSRPQIVRTNLSDIGAYELDPNEVRIIVPPASTNVLVGSNVTFSVTAEGTGPLFYHWFFNRVIVDGFTGSSLTITNVQTTNAGNFQVVVSNNFNSITSSIAVLSVSSITNSPPSITQGPVSQTIAAGSNVTFTVTATGTAPLFYQWVFQVSSTVFSNIPAANAASFSIANVQTTNAGNYGVVITNNFGSTNSQLATLFVTTNSSSGPPPFP